MYFWITKTNLLRAREMIIGRVVFFHFVVVVVQSFIFFGRDRVMRDVCGKYGESIRGS